jgi:hypothetical protein
MPLKHVLMRILKGALSFRLPFLPLYIILLIPSIVTSALEDGDSTLLRNVGFYQPVHTAPKPRRTSSLLKGDILIEAFIFSQTVKLQLKHLTIARSTQSWSGIVINP